MQRWVPFLLLFAIMVIFKVGFILGVCVCVCFCIEKQNNSLWLDGIKGVSP